LANTSWMERADQLLPWVPVRITPHTEISAKPAR
jgi:hypothetical protein